MKISNPIFMICLPVFALLLTTAACSSVTTLSGPKVDKSGVIDCYRETFTSVAEPNSQRNEVHERHRLLWYLIGSTDTNVTIDFVTKTGFEACRAESPFNDPSKPLAQKITNKNFKLDILKSPKVLKGKGAQNEGDPPVCYTYKITCTWPDGTTKTIDPIIEIPKP